MFTGLIEQVGHIAARQQSGASRKLTISHEPWQGAQSQLQPGDSVAVNGACLTAETVERNHFICSVLDETIVRTSLADKPLGAPVNLERAMAADARFGGHMVQGHVDACGTVTNISQPGTDRILKVQCPDDTLAGIVEKGSVALDGISLTVATLGPDGFTVHIIPFTWNHTALVDLAAGSPINIETDIIGKYVQRYLEGYDRSNVSVETLSAAGSWVQ